jgi:hypothetical protein
MVKKTKENNEIFYKIIIHLKDNIIIEYVKNEKDEKDVVAYYKFMEEYADYDELVENDKYKILTDFVKYEVDKTLLNKSEIKDYRLYYDCFDWRDFVKNYGEDGSRFPTIDKIKSSSISHDEHYKQLEMRDAERKRRTEYIQIIEKQPQYQHRRLFSKCVCNEDDHDEKCDSLFPINPKNCCGLLTYSILDKPKFLNDVYKNLDECYTLTGIS